MRHGGLTYLQARRCYDSMVRTVEDGICTATKVKFGKVGAIVPVRKPPRTVSLNCKVSKGREVSKARHVFNLGPRVVFKFQMYRSFKDRTRLTWYDEEVIPNA